MTQLGDLTPKQLSQHLYFVHSLFTHDPLSLGSASVNSSLALLDLLSDNPTFMHDPLSLGSAMLSFAVT